MFVGNPSEGNLFDNNYPSWWVVFSPLFVSDALNAYFCVIVFIRMYIDVSKLNCSSTRLRKQEKILPKFVFPIFAFKLLHFKVQTLVLRRKKFGRIDSWGQFHQRSTLSFCANSLVPVKYKPKMQAQKSCARNLRT